MGYSLYDPAVVKRAGNAGEKVETKRPLTQEQLCAVGFFLDHRGRLRDRALFELAIDNKLRGCDLVRIDDLHSHAQIAARQIEVLDPHHLDIGPDRAKIFEEFGRITDHHDGRSIRRDILRRHRTGRLGRDALQIGGVIRCLARLQSVH